ncbi:MAG: sodium-translocating pyrophosphatase [Candidatus Bathyarchaeia archaeon]
MLGKGRFMNTIALVAPAAGVIAQFLSALLAHTIFHKSSKSGIIMDISKIIRDSAITYLNKQFLFVAVFGAILAVMAGLAFGLLTAVTFSLGATFSAISAYISTLIAVNANSRTVRAANKGFHYAFLTAFRYGTAIGLSLTGFGLLIISGLYLALSSLGYSNPASLVGLGFGASLVGLFTRVGGGIYTKAADISADLVGKVEMGLAEDDPRNPAAIADQVGDNVGDVAGTGSDVFQSYVCTSIAAMILGSSLYGDEGIVYPLAVLGFGLLSSAAGSLFLRLGGRRIRFSVYSGVYASAILASLASALLSMALFGSLNVFYATLTGIIAILLLTHTTEYYTSPEKKPVEAIAKASGTGPAVNILSGLSAGLEGTALPVIIFSAAILLAYLFEGLYGITLVAAGFLSIMATFISMASYGPIVDNANGLVTMSRMGDNLRRTMDMLDSVGNITKAICKVYAIGTSALAQVALFSAYLNAAHLSALDAASPKTISGMLIGGVLSFFLCSLIIRAVSRAAYVMIREIRRQLNGSMNGELKPDYNRCISISTKAALGGMFYPAAFSIAVPFAVGIFLGPESLGGLMAGNLVTTLPLSLFMCISGAAWDNAKKYIETGGYGGRGSSAHEASVIGDTVGDPLKDAVGPSLDIFINLIGTIALISATYIFNR